MQAPEWFVEELDSDSGGRYRVRWSARRGRWQVEERIGRQSAKRRVLENTSEEAIRENDGMRLLFEITPGTRTHCPRCHRWMQVRVATEMPRTSRCGTCLKEWKFCFMPLGSALLQYLRYIQPERGGLERVLPDVEAAEKARAVAKRRELHRNTEAIWKEDFTKNFEIDSVGWGKHSGTRTWK